MREPSSRRRDTPTIDPDDVEVNDINNNSISVPANRNQTLTFKMAPQTIIQFRFRQIGLAIIKTWTCKMAPQQHKLLPTDQSSLQPSSYRSTNFYAMRPTDIDRTGIFSAAPRWVIQQVKSELVSTQMISKQRCICPLACLLVGGFCGYIADSGF